MPQRFRTAAITDEFSPDLDAALEAMSQVGMTGAELRTVSGKNVADWSDEEVDRAAKAVRAAGMKVAGIASPLLKCALPAAPPVDPRFQQDSFAARHSFEDQESLAARIFEIARRAGAPIVRVFSFWRTVDPNACFERVAQALRTLAEKGAASNLAIALENEHACNIATAAETARLLAAVDHPNLKIVWDPANALVSGENPFPGGYSRLPASRIAHVHAKDCVVRGHKPEFGPLGTMGIDWRGQIDALARDGYEGWISLETHWPGPEGDKLQGSMICGRNLRELVSISSSPDSTTAGRAPGRKTGNN